MLRGVYVLLLMFPTAALAQEQHFHPPEHAALHDEFYKNWMRPDNPKISCCNLNDCAPVEHVRRNSYGGWDMQRSKDGAWITIPPEKMELNRDTPDGRSHMCSNGDLIFCAILGSGG
jgi:hypothetical protein